MKLPTTRIALALVVLTASSGDPPEGLGHTPGGSGPRVLWDADREPDAEVPFPNNSATVLDPASPTGRRLNLSLDSPLHAERHLRERLNRLDGFSLFGAITVSFDSPLDLATVTDASVLLVNVTPGSPDLGKTVPLDLGRGAYPSTMRPRALFPYDPGATLPDLLFPLDNDVGGRRVEHWEVATNTLILRPLFPLRPRSTYAVVLTRGVKGLDGAVVQSPFAGINPAAQTESLRPALTAVTGGAKYPSTEATSRGGSFQWPSIALQSAP